MRGQEGCLLSISDNESRHFHPVDFLTPLGRHCPEYPGAYALDEPITVNLVLSSCSLPWGF
jgi:hypothetical protein